MDPHHGRDPSAFVVGCAWLVPPGPVLDVAAGGGRSGRVFLDRGHAVTFVDRDLAGLLDLDGRADVERVQADLEADPWPLPGRTFAAVVATSYLWRPLLPVLVGAVAPGGVLIYETFAAGHVGRPSNPAYLLRPGELLEVVAGRLEVRRYHHGPSEGDPGRVRQGICAVRPPGG